MLYSFDCISDVASKPAPPYEALCRFSNECCVLTLHCTTLNNTALHFTTIQYNALHCATLNFTTLPYVKLHYTALQFTTMYYAALHCTALTCNAIP